MYMYFGGGSNGLTQLRTLHIHNDIHYTCNHAHYTYIITHTTHTQSRTLHIHNPAHYTYTITHTHIHTGWENRDASKPRKEGVPKLKTVSGCAKTGPIHFQYTSFTQCPH